MGFDAWYILSHQSERVSACLSTYFFSLSLTAVYFRWLRKQPEARRMSPALLLMKMNFLSDIPLTFVRMCLIRSTCAATAITFWRKPCKRSVGIGTAQPASPGLYGRSLLQRVTPPWRIQELLRVVLGHCAQQMSLWLPGPQDHGHFTIWKYLPAVDCRLLSTSSCFQCESLQGGEGWVTGLGRCQFFCV